MGQNRRLSIDAANQTWSKETGPKMRYQIDRSKQTGLNRQVQIDRSKQTVWFKLVQICPIRSNMVPYSYLGIIEMQQQLNSAPPAFFLILGALDSSSSFLPWPFKACNFVIPYNFKKCKICSVHSYHAWHCSYYTVHYTTGVITTQMCSSILVAVFLIPHTTPPSASVHKAAQFMVKGEGGVNPIIKVLRFFFALFVSKTGFKGVENESKTVKEGLSQPFTIAIYFICVPNKVEIGSKRLLKNVNNKKRFLGDDFPFLSYVNKQCKLLCYENK